MFIFPNTMDSPSTGDFPAITQAFPTAVHHDLLARQNGGPICGYVNADIATPVSCASGYQCGINTYDYAFNCCQDVADCYYHTDCVPYASLGDCNTACQDNPYVTKCDNENYPYCYVKTFYFTAYTDPFFEYDCYNVGGYETVWQTFTQTNSVATPVQPVIITVTQTATQMATQTATEIATQTAQTVTQTAKAPPGTTQVSSINPFIYSTVLSSTSVSPESTPPSSQNNAPTNTPLMSSQQAAPTPQTQAPDPASDPAPSPASDTQTANVPSPNAPDNTVSTEVVTEVQTSIKSTQSAGAQHFSTTTATLAGDGGGTSCNGGQNCNDPTNNGGTQQIVQIKNGSGRLHIPFSFQVVSGILGVIALLFLRL